ncbi:M16 family metallopeptidase [Patescibacteria group bacterium]
MFKVLSQKLDSGLTVVLSPYKTPVTVCCLRGLAGSNFEKKPEIGAAHSLEHLITYGTKNFPSKYLFRSLVTAKGGRITGTTSREDVAFLTKTLSSDYKRGVTFLSEIFDKPLLRKDDYNAVKNNIKQEILSNKEIPYNHLLRTSYKILYPKQRFETFSTGTIKHVEKMKMARMKEFHRKYYQPQNFVLAVCGDIRFDELVRFTNNHTKTKGDKRVESKPPIRYRNLKVQVERRTLKQTHIKIDFYGFMSSERKKYSAYFLARYLENKLDVWFRYSGVRA